MEVGKCEPAHLTGNRNPPEEGGAGGLLSALDILSRRHCPLPQPIQLFSSFQSGGN